MMAAPRCVTPVALESALAEVDRLRAQVTSLLVTHRTLSSLLVSADNRSGELLKLLVAVRALIESRDAATALASLSDILLNVVGADDFVIFATDARDNTLVPIGGVGPSAAAARRVPMSSGFFGDVVIPETLLLECDRGTVLRPRHAPDVVAVVPLTVLDRVVGVITIARMLPHRAVMSGCDREILALLGVYAATAIIAAEERAGWVKLPEVAR